MTRNAIATSPPKKPMVRPATAGPMIRAPLKTAELRATAFATSPRPTISTVNAWRVGMSTALVMPSSGREHEDVPDLHAAGDDEREQAKASAIWTPG